MVGEHSKLGIRSVLFVNGWQLAVFCAVVELIDRLDARTVLSDKAVWSKKRKSSANCWHLNKQQIQNMEESSADF